jgi:hypothetical protein
MMGDITREQQLVFKNSTLKADVLLQSIILEKGALRLVLFINCYYKWKIKIINCTSGRPGGTDIWDQSRSTPNTTFLKVLRFSGIWSVENIGKDFF